MNSSPVKVKLIIFPLFLPEGIAILPMTAKEPCDCTPCTIHTAHLEQYTRHTCKIHTACLAQYKRAVQNVAAKSDMFLMHPFLGQSQPSTHYQGALFRTTNLPHAQTFIRKLPPYTIKIRIFFALTGFQI